MNTPSIARAELRSRLLAERDAWVKTAADPSAAAALAGALCDTVAQLEPQCLGVYWPLGSEFNAAPALAADARTMKLALALPFSRRTPRQMEFRYWDGAPAQTVDECGIGSSDGAVVVPDVVVVPCVGFTASGHRLGYGGGYYDRWLALHPEVVAVGVAWSFAEIGPADYVAEAHDVALAFVVTERGVR